MERSSKILYGIASIIPIIQAFIWIIIFFSKFMPIWSRVVTRGSEREYMAFMFESMAEIMIPMILVSFITIGVMILFIVNVFRNPNVPKSKHALWAILIGLLGTYTMPVYWYFYIWKDPVVDLHDPYAADDV